MLEGTIRGERWWVGWLAGAGVGLAVAFWPRTAEACPWHSESYAAEAQSLPCVFDAVIGSYPKHGRAFHLARIAGADALLDWAPAHLSAWDMKGVALLKLARYRDAELAMLRRAALSPGAYASHANLGTLYTFTGDWAKALSEIERALTLEPRAHFGREKYHRMLVEYLRDLKAEPTLAQRDDFLRLALTPEQRLGGSAQAFKDAGADPALFDALVSMIAVYGADRVSHVYLALGEALALRGDVRLAWTAYERAVELKHPRSAEIEAWQRALQTKLRAAYDKDPKAWRAQFPASELPVPEDYPPGFADYQGVGAAYEAFQHEWELEATRYVQRAKSYTTWETAQVAKGLPVWREAGLTQLYAKANEVRPRCQSPGVILGLPLVAPPAVASPPSLVASSAAARLEAEKYVSALEGVGRVFDSQRGKCDALAKALADLGSERETLGGTAAAEAHRSADGDPALSARLDDASRAIADGSLSCAKNPAFLSLRRRLATKANVSAGRGARR